MERSDLRVIVGLDPDSGLRRHRTLPVTDADLATLGYHRIDHKVTKEYDGHPIEFGFCTAHNSLAERFDDGSWGCWLESIVELSLDHEHPPSAFMPVVVIPAATVQDHTP